MAHVFARIVQVFAFDVGGTLIYWSRDSTRLLDDIKEARPTYFASVPRVWEKIHTAATSGIADQSWLKRALFKWALDVGHRTSELKRDGVAPGRALALQYRVADRLVLQKVRDLFGGRLELTITAAAPIPRDVLEFFDACGIVLLEVWGMTELCGAGTLNTESERKLGSVGRPLPDLEMGTADDGELHARGPIVFAGYFKDEQATRETLPGGWLATGDLGEIDSDGFVTITGRKKDLIITSSGKNITPANIENALKESRWISEAVVYGDGRPYLVALLTLDAEEAPKLAAQLGVPADIQTMSRDERVRAELQKAVDAANCALRPDRADQALRDSRPRADTGATGTHPNPEGQAGVRLPRVQRHLQRAIRGLIHAERTRARRGAHARQRCLLLVHGEGPAAPLDGGLRAAPRPAPRTGTASPNDSSAARARRPGFRHRVVMPPLRLATPRWVVDPDFDLDWHVRRFEAAPPKTLASVLEFARKTGMAGLDKDRPLWEFTFIEGLKSGQTALVMKLHHSLTDGVGGMDIARLLFDVEPDPGDLGPMPEAPDPRAPRHRRSREGCPYLRLVAPVRLRQASPRPPRSATRPTRCATRAARSARRSRPVRTSRTWSSRCRTRSRPS